MAWTEVRDASEGKRRELVLSGAEISSRINENGLDSNIFSLQHVNFLEISKTCLTRLPDDIANLSSLNNLILHHNKLEILPSGIGKLAKLKTFDVSGNRLRSIPDEISALIELQSLNVSVNELDSFPQINSMVQLHILDVSHNHLDALPDGICDSSLVSLAQIIANSNEITELPDDLCDLPSLRVLNIDDNKLTELPCELSQCLKLKELSFSGNKLKDRRLLKMGEQCKTKSILDYLSKSMPKKQKKEKEAAAHEKKKAKEISKKERKKNRKIDQETENLSVDVMKVLHFKEESGMSIQITDRVSVVRPYIVCSVVKYIDFKKASNLFKRFINVQTKLHDSVCQKRNAATIATHDLTTTHFPLIYDARPPTDITIRPLFRQKDTTAEKLVAKLMLEAEEQRKEKKRNQVTGIHKYLDLLKGKPLYPCLVDKEGTVISFPPITNCDYTKISEDTTAMLIEVTSTLSLDTCKSVMEELLKEMLELGLGTSPSGDQEEAAGGEGETDERHQLVVEQVKILDTEGHMKVVYPSRVDLVSEAFRVLRDYD